MDIKSANETYRHKDQTFFSALDGLRGVAAICVVIYHYSRHFAYLENDLSKEMLTNAFLAVDFFFMLSGFVIMHAYHAKLAQGLSVWGLMRRRLIRLYPLYFVGVTIPVVLFVIEILTT